MSDIVMECFEADGFVFDVDVTFEGGSGVSTLVGSTVSVAAISKAVPTRKVQGTAVVAGATTFTCTLDEWSLTEGDWWVQPRIDPPGVTPQTPDDAVFTLRVKKSAFPKP